MERCLAAILAADVLGYSRLMGADEEATFSLPSPKLRSGFAQAGTLGAHREVMDDLIGRHHGRVVGATA